MTPAAHNHTVYLMLARTPTHVGCGMGLGDIDLPITRNARGVPILPGSAVKGVLRQFAPSAWDCDANWVRWLFGPEPTSAVEGTDAGAMAQQGMVPPPPPFMHAGMLAPQDAGLLLMPVASLRGGWVWATSPETLRRFRRDAQSLAPAGMPELPATIPTDDEVLVSPAGRALLSVPGADPAVCVIGEAALVPKADDGVAAWGRYLAAAACPGEEPAWQDMFAQRLAVVSDDLFAYFSRTCTEVRSRVEVGRDRVASEHKLWREECVPADSVFWGVLSVLPVVDAGRHGGPSVPQALQRVRPAHVQIGGKASVGYGWADFLPLHAAAGGAR